MDGRGELSKTEQIPDVAPLSHLQTQKEGKATLFFFFFKQRVSERED